MIQLTKFSAKRSLADTEEATQMKNGSFHHSTAQKHRQAQVNIVHWEIFCCCGKRCILMVTEERMITVNNFHGLQLNRKLSEPRVNVPQVLGISIRYSRTVSS